MGSKPEYALVQAARNRERYANDPAYRAKVLAAADEYKRRDPERARAAVRDWHDRNREYIRAYKREWRAKNKDKVRLYAMRDKIRKRGSAASVDKYYAVVVYADPCSYCGAPAEHVDHIDAFAKGGSGEWINLTAACGRCNRQKWTRSLLFFLLERTART